MLYPKNKIVIKTKKIIPGFFLSTILLISILSGCTDSSEKQQGNAPNFTLTTIDGGRFTLSDHFGKIIVLDFMAAWCHYCTHQMKELEAVLEEKGDEILVVSIDVDKRETADDIKNTFGEYIDKWVFALNDYNENVEIKYKVYGIPKIVIIDINGNIYYSMEGLTSRNKILEEINKIEQEQGGHTKNGQ